MKTITAILILTSILSASCNWYITEINETIPKLEAMQQFNAPTQIVTIEKRKLIRLLENAERLCDKKDYYRTLIKFYKGV